MYKDETLDEFFFVIGLAGYFDIHPTTLEKAEANRRAAEEAANNETENSEEEISAEIS